MQPHLTPADEVLLDRWWAERPSRPPALKIAQPPIGAALCTITCRVCGQRDSIAVDWPGLLCRRCRGDLAATRANVTLALDELRRKEDDLMTAWAARQAALDDDTAARWTKLCADRSVAEARALRLRTAKYRDDVTTEEAAAKQREAEQALVEVLAKIERTRRNPASLLAPLLKAEEAHVAELARLKALRVRLEIALQEIAAAEDGNAPF